MNIPKLALLQEEMDRKDFLKHVGVGALLVMGGNMVVGALTGLNRVNNTGTATTSSTATVPSRRSFGYGMSAYGK